MTEPTDRALDALVQAADDGVDHDGLKVVHDDDGYRVETPDASRTGLDESGLRAAARAVPRHVTDWDHWRRAGAPDSYRYAFLRWLERAEEWSVSGRYDALADGVVREWGELAVTVTLDDAGGRRYAVCHIDDLDTPRDELATHEDPLALREVRTYDDDGRYRPLSTAPTLAHGWRAAGLDAHEVVDAVEALYPATVANWHRERTGALDITHWTETADRQTGIYEVVDELPNEAVEWVAEACCVDSQCLKRREWDHDVDDALDVPRGDAAFPCREPCSLVIAAARKWTELEAETEQTYEFELTPSEKEQLEALIDAVADGRTDDIREADVYEGANRYRTRYLRAKRVTDGDLCGVSTDE